MREGPYLFKQFKEMGVCSFWIGAGSNCARVLCVGIAFCYSTPGHGATNRAQLSTLNVTDFGARGDATKFAAGTSSESAVVTVQSGDRLSEADVGKLVLLFGAGLRTTPTNNQDLVATIIRVLNGTNLTLSVKAGTTAENVIGMFGTQNATAFQNCVNACTGTNTTIIIPPGRYLLVPPKQLTDFALQSGFGPVAAAVTIRRGGIHFLGAGRDATVLVGCGAWLLKGGYAHRGWMFACQGPITNDAPLVFESLTMEGGVPDGLQSYHGFPARTTDGAGWDVTHDAVVDCGTTPLHAFKAFRNCRFTHWRGEMLKSGVSMTDGFIEVSDCLFVDGNASGFNFSFSHTINGCTFSNLFLALEFYQGYCTKPCYFQNSIITNIAGNVMAITGALKDHVQPSYNIVSNSFFLSRGYGILTTPAQNLFVIGNRFICREVAPAIGLGCEGYQGTAINSNIVVAFNSFSNASDAVVILGGGLNRIANVLICSNRAESVLTFASGYGWSTNVWFLGNVSTSGRPLLSGQLQGQWFLDDVSNCFPPWTVGDAGDRTNIVTYAMGMRQETWNSKPDSAFAIDDVQPEKIPPGAVLTIIHRGKYPLRLSLSSSRPGATPMVISNGCTATCAWVDGAWRPVGEELKR
jgi:hypothetical protein